MYSGYSSQRQTQILTGNNILTLNKLYTTTFSLSKKKNSFSFGSHQSFPLRYGWIEKFCMSMMKDKFSKTISRDYLRPEALSLKYGLGNNMAKSIRFWLKACRITNDIPNSKKDPEFTDFATKVFAPDGDDVYLEKKETIWRLHYNLVTHNDLATTWFWFFNIFKKQTFDRQQLVNEIFSAVSTENKFYTEANIKRDVDCFVRSYVGSTTNNMQGDEALECPFVELNLIRKGFGNTLVANRGEQKSLPDDLFLFSIINLWLSRVGQPSTITVETLLNEPFSPGCIFLLNRDSLIERLEKINEFSNGSIILDQSSGLAQILVKEKELIKNFKELFPKNLSKNAA